MISCLKDEILDGSRINSTCVSTEGIIVDILFAVKLSVHYIFLKWMAVII